METSIKSSEIYQLCKQISILANDLERYENLKIKSINSEEKLKKKCLDLKEENRIILEDNKKLKTEKNKVIRENNNFTIKNSNLQKRIEKYEEIYSVIPGTTREDKYRFLLFITNDVLQWLIESSYSRTFKKVVEFWDTFIKKQENDKKYIGGYYVYSHTIIGEKYPFYIGFSRNNDGQYNRSKEFTGRHETWHEYVNARGDKTDIDVNIIGEIKTEEAAIELEKFYIRHYSENVVNIQFNNSPKES